MPQAKPYRYWFVGDSLTFNALQPAGFRWRANQIVVVGDWPTTFVGSLRDGNWLNNNHDGQPNDTVGDRLTFCQGAWGPGNGIPNAKGIALLICTNDARALTAPATVLGTYKDLVRLFRDVDPFVEIAVSDIPLLDPVLLPAEAAAGIAINALFPATWEELNAEYPHSPPLRTWSAKTALAPGGSYTGGLMLADGIHPNDDGNLALANAFAPVFYQTASVGRSTAVYSIGAF